MTKPPTHKGAPAPDELEEELAEGPWQPGGYGFAALAQVLEALGWPAAGLSPVQVAHLSALVSETIQALTELLDELDTIQLRETRRGGGRI